MDAFFARNRLSAYIDGQLSDDEAAELTAELAADPALAAEYQAMKAAVDILRADRAVRAPAHLHDRVMAAIAAERPPAANRVVPGFRRWGLALVAAAAALLVLPLYRQFSPESSSTEEIPRVEVVADGPEAEEPTLVQPQALPAPASPKPKVLKELASSSPRPRVGQKPDTPYVPSWDQEDGTSDLIGADPGVQVLAGGLHSRPTAEWRITLADPDTLYRLDELARGSGGDATDSRGRPLQLRELSVEQNHAVVQIVVPPGQSDKVATGLAALGGAETTPMPDNGVSDAVVFSVDVQYKP